MCLALSADKTDPSFFPAVITESTRHLVAFFPNILVVPPVPSLCLSDQWIIIPGVKFYIAAGEEKAEEYKKTVGHQGSSAGPELLYLMM